MMNLAWGERHEAVVRRFAGPRFRRRIMSLSARVAVSTHIRGEYRKRVSLLRFLAARRARIDLGSPLEEQIAMLNRFRPHQVSSLGTFVGVFFREIRDRGIEAHRPRLITVAGDGIPDGDRRMLEEGLGIPVVMSWQSAESLKIGFECEERSGFHLHEDLCHVRILDDEGRDLPDGETGRVHITNLVNRASVLINYDLGDQGRMLPDECVCGRKLRRMELVEGRRWPLLRSLDGGFHHYATILDPLQDEELAGRGQIVVERPDHWRLRLPPPPGDRPADWRDRGLARARGVAGPGIEITLEEVDRSPRTESGKWVPVLIRCAGTPPYV